MYSKINSRQFSCFSALFSNKNVSWQAALDPKLTKSQTVNSFKKSLSIAIYTKKWPLKSSLEYKVLYELLRGFSSSENPIKMQMQLRRLEQLILQKRISDTDIYHAIQRVTGKNVINVVKPIRVPAELKKKSMSSNFSPLQIHPGSGPIKEISVNIMNDTNNKQATVEFNSEQKESKLDTITGEEIVALKKFLEKAERQEKDIKNFVLQQQRKYDWFTNEETEKIPSTGSMIFERAPSLKSLGRIFPFTLISSNIDSLALSPMESKNILVYDISQSEEVIVPKNDPVLLNVQYKDLFGVINMGKYAPDLLLELVNKYESQGWKLVGDIVEDNYKIIFRQVRKTDKSRSLKSKIAISVATALVSLFILGEFV